jgi:hypothetical protein
MGRGQIAFGGIVAVHLGIHRQGGRLAMEDLEEAVQLALHLVEIVLIRAYIAVAKPVFLTHLL